MTSYINFFLENVISSYLIKCLKLLSISLDIIAHGIKICIIFTICTTSITHFRILEHLIFKCSIYKIVKRLGFCCCFVGVILNLIKTLLLYVG